MVPVLGVLGGGEHQPSDALGMAHGDLQGGQSAEAEAEEVGLLDAEFVQQGHHVTGQVRHRDRTVDVGGVSVALEFGSHDVPGGGQGGQHGPEGEADREDTAVQQHQRAPGVAGGAVRLVVHGEAVDLGVRGVARHGHHVRSVGIGYQVDRRAVRNSSVPREHTPVTRSPPPGESRVAFRPPGVDTLPECWPWLSPSISAAARCSAWPEPPVSRQEARPQAPCPCGNCSPRPPSMPLSAWWACTSASSC